MKLKEWRKKRKLTQAELALALGDYARNQGKPIKNLKQSTIGYWERGTLPRKWWLGMIADYTKGQVTPGDFVAPDSPPTQESPNMPGTSYMQESPGGA